MSFTLRFRNATAGAVLFQTVAALVCIAAIVASGMYGYCMMMDRAIVSGAPPVLDFELQAPAGKQLPMQSEIRIELQAGKARSDVE